MNKSFICLAVFLLTGILHLYAQDMNNDKDIAYLLEGPVMETGLPGIGENVIPCYRGTYSLNGNTVRVSYTTEEVIIFSEWKTAEKNGFRFYIINENTICYINRGKWSLFIEYDSLDNIYDFSAELTKKMLFFAKTEEFFKSSSFPAIININR